MAPDAITSTASDLGIRWTLAPAVVLARTPSGAWLLDLDRGFFALESSGADLLEWALLHGPDEAAHLVAEAYAIHRHDADAGVAALRRDLEAYGLLAGCRRGVGPIRRGLAGLVAACAPWAASLWPSRPAAAVRSVLVLAWLAIRLEGFAAALTRWRSRVGAPGAAARIGRLVRLVSCSYGLPPCACKERAMASDLLLRAVAGVRPTIVLAVRPTPFTAHTWAEWRGRPVGDDPRHCARFRRVAVLDR